jgi:gamma-glutamylcyclotransferase (GGCT)/AIG2-like uncharacterized protein YtfP
VRVKLFVYGTLLRGEANHALLTGSRFLGEARTEPVFELVSFGEYPAMVRGGSTVVLGEVYEVDAETLAQVDELEEHPHFFRREMVRLEGEGEAFVYVVTRETARGRPRIPSGDWRLG